MSSNFLNNKKKTFFQYILLLYYVQYVVDLNYGKAYENQWKEITCYYIKIVNESL